MPATIHTAPVSTASHWAGRIIGALAVLFLAFDTVIKVLRLAPAVESTAQLGYPEHLTLAIGLLELACLAVYVIPRTSVLGAIMLTGYPGAAISAREERDQWCKRRLFTDTPSRSRPPFS